MATFLNLPKLLPSDNEVLTPAPKRTSSFSLNLPPIREMVDARPVSVSNHINPGSVQPHGQNFGIPEIDQTRKVTRGSGPGPVVNSDGQGQFVNTNPGQQGITVEVITNSVGTFNGEIQIPRAGVASGRSDGNALGLASDSHPAGQSFTTHSVGSAQETSTPVDVHVISAQALNLKPATFNVR